MKAPPNNAKNAPAARNPILIAPSLLSADTANLQEELRRIESAGCEWVHIDIFDGRFAPNLSFGPKLVQDLRKRASLFLDLHLMLHDPAPWVERFAGADQITVHIEAADDIQPALDAVRNAGCKVGLALKPDSPAEAAFPYLDQIDLLLPMTVQPGFSGQRFMPEVLPKIADLRDEMNRRGANPVMQADGGVSVQTAPDLARAGVTAFVAGSALFNAPDFARAAQNIRQAAQNALEPQP